MDQLENQQTVHKIRVNPESRKYERPGTGEEATNKGMEKVRNDFMVEESIWEGRLNSNTGVV